MALEGLEPQHSTTYPKGMDQKQSFLLWKFPKKREKENKILTIMHAELYKKKLDEDK